MALRKKGKIKSSSPTNPHVLEYLAAVERFSSNTNSPSENECPDAYRATGNMQSLLKEHIVKTKDDKFFASFVEEFRAAADITCTTTGDTTAKIKQENEAEGGATINAPPLSSAQRKILHDLAQETVLNKLDQLFEEYTFATAKDASLTDDLRQQQSNNDESNHHHITEDSLVYGEIDLKGFCHLLQSLPIKPGGKFYDLGGGSGRAVFAARFQEDFDECIGLELLSNLHQLAVSVQSLYKFLYRSELKHRDVSFRCTDLIGRLILRRPWCMRRTSTYRILFNPIIGKCCDRISEFRSLILLKTLLVVLT